MPSANGTQAVPPSKPIEVVRSLALAATCAFAAALHEPPVAAAATSPPVVSRENEVKAAALYNIIVFTDWPATAFARADAPLVVGVLGHGPTADLLKDAIANETWRGRKVVLEEYTSPAQARNCHVLYISRSEQERWANFRAQFAGRPVLTVSDAPGFAQNGGIVQFGIERNRLKLTVNLAAARAGGLTVSSKVLRLAAVIGEPGG